jgi:hypothetical protein
MAGFVYILKIFVNKTISNRKPPFGFWMINGFVFCMKTLHNTNTTHDTNNHIIRWIFLTLCNGLHLKLQFTDVIFHWEFPLQHPTHYEHGITFSSLNLWGHVICYERKRLASWRVKEVENVTDIQTTVAVSNDRKMHYFQANLLK